MNNISFSISYLSGIKDDFFCCPSCFSLENLIKYCRSSLFCCFHLLCFLFVCLWGRGEMWGTVFMNTPSFQARPPIPPVVRHQARSSASRGQGSCSGACSTRPLSCLSVRWGKSCEASFPGQGQVSTHRFQGFRESRMVFLNFMYNN